MIGDVLPLCDFTAVLFAAALATLAYSSWFSSTAVLSAIWEDGGRAALVAAVLAPLILCDRAFVAFASSGQTAALIRCYAVRFVMFAGTVATLGIAGRSLEGLPHVWLVLWLASSLMTTALLRFVLVANLRRLERKGVLKESIAVVGAGPIADRLIGHLMQTRSGSVEIVGVFDDRANRADGCIHQPVGSIADLVALGKSRQMDWIVLALPASAERRAAQLKESIVHRLKSLSVPIGLCPENVGLAALPRTSAWHSAIAAVETVVPRWILTLLSLPLSTLRKLRRSLRARHLQHSRTPRLPCVLDNYDLPRFTAVAAAFGQHRYGYVVTPNADHLIRLHREPSFRALYAEAAYVLLDSRFVAHLLHFTRKLRLSVCTGSDLTAKLFDDVIEADDRLVLIGGSDEQAARLSRRYGLKRLAHLNPPMDFIHDPQAVEACLQFIEAHSPFRYCLLAVGAPQQEAIAQRLKARGVARGLALCIGASINFLTGDEQRAPLWMQSIGMEWLFRLLRAPRRMAQRYLVQGPRLFALLRRTDIVLRAASALPAAAARPRTYQPVAKRRTATV